MTGPTGPELVAPITDWSSWLKCPICRAGPGHPCIAAHAAVVDGHPAGGATVLQVAHSRRRRRAQSRTVDGWGYRAG